MKLFALASVATLATSVRAFDDREVYRSDYMQLNLYTDSGCGNFKSSTYLGSNNVQNGICHYVTDGDPKAYSALITNSQDSDSSCKLFWGERCEEDTKFSPHHNTEYSTIPTWASGDKIMSECYGTWPTAIRSWVCFYNP
jgi:hypothetical protein